MANPHVEDEASLEDLDPSSSPQKGEVAEACPQEVSYQAVEAEVEQNSPYDFESHSSCFPKQSCSARNWVEGAGHFPSILPERQFGVAMVVDHLMVPWEVVELEWGVVEWVEHQQTVDEVCQLVKADSEWPRDVQRHCHAAPLWNLS